MKVVNVRDHGNAQHLNSMKIIFISWMVLCSICCKKSTTNITASTVIEKKLDIQSKENIRITHGHFTRKEKTASKTECEKIWQLLANSQIYKNTTKWEMLGFFRIKNLKKIEVEVAIYDRKDENVLFEIDGEYYKASGIETVKEILK